MTIPLARPGASAPADERFRAIFAAHYPPVAAYTARRLGRSEGMDAAAEVFTVAWRRLARVPDEPATLPWLYGVARNVVRNAERSRRRRDRLAVRVASTADATDTTGPEPDDEVMAALAALRPDDQEILRLHAWEDLGPAEIAVVLSISNRAASMRLHRARNRLAAALERGNAR